MKNEDERLTAERDDDVARLVRLAGKRTAVPAERAARVREAAHAAWVERVGRRQRRQRLVWSAAAAASVALVMFLVIRGGGVGPVPRGATDVSLAAVEALGGTAWRDGRDRLALGDTVAAGDSLATDDDGRVALRLASGHSVRLDAASSITIEPDAVVALHRGALYVDSGADADPAVALEVRTSRGTIREIGTQFAVRSAADGALTVRLREGAALVEHDDGRLRIEAGEELSIDAAGQIERRTIATHDRRWSWTEAIAPPIELAGRSARSFLDEVARERGWTLLFTDEQVARDAKTIVLGGSLEPMALDDALDAVMPTCRMRWHVADGHLIVSPEP